MVETYQEFGKSTDKIIAKLKEKFQMSEEEALKCVEHTENTRRAQMKIIS